MSRKLAIIIPTLNNGGAERVASNISCNLSAGIRQHIILYDGSRIDYPYRGELINLNITTGGNPFSKLKAFIQRYYRVKRLKRERKIDFAISFLGNPNLINILTKGRERVIISVRSCLSAGLRGLHGRLYAFLIKCYYNKADVVVAVSRQVKKDLVENFGIAAEKVRVIYNPYDLRKIEEQSREELQDREDFFKHPVIVNSGRLTYQKGQWHLIRAFKRVKEHCPEARLMIMGQGRLEGRLRGLSEELGLGDDVAFPGFMSNPFKYLKQSQVFVLSSLYEGFPNVLAEAMACGLPVVSTDCSSGPREILAPETGLEYKTDRLEEAGYGILTPLPDGKYYQAGDPLTAEERLLADGVIMLLNDSQLRARYASAAGMRVRDFAREKIISRWEEMLEEMPIEGVMNGRV